ncbi:LPP20 family lipoprotein [Planctomycetota bacterium]
MKKLITCSLVIFVLLAGCGGGAPAPKDEEGPAVKTVTGKPEWASSGETRTHAKGRYWLAVGIGDTPQQASQIGREEVAAQIRTHVRSRIMDVARMEGENLKERFESISQSITDERLEGLEIIEQYTGRRRSYALAALNKSTYLGRIRDQVTDLYKKAKAKYDQALAQKAQGGFPAYFTLLSEASEVVQQVRNPEYFLRSFIQGGSQDGELAFKLSNAISGEIIGFLAEIKITVDGSGQKGSAGQALERPLKASFTAFGKPVAGFPVRFTTEKGRVTMEADARTDKDGTAACIVTRIERSPVKTIKLTATLDLAGLKGIQAKYLDKGGEFTIAMDEISKWVIFVAESGKNGIVVSKVVGDMKAAGVEVNQLNLDFDFDEKVLLKAVNGKKALREQYSLILGNFTAREVDKAMGTSTCRADGYVKGIELSTQRVLFQRNIEEVIGVSYTGNADEGCRAALSKAGIEAAKIVKKELGY